MTIELGKEQIRISKNTMSQYTASVPSDGAVKPEIKAFFEKFYAVSDTPDGHEQYADMFTNDGTLIMGPNKTQGRDSKLHINTTFDLSFQF